MDEKEKLKVEIRKMYSEQIEKFDSKIYFTFLSLSVTLTILHFTSTISYWWGIGAFVVTLIAEAILDSRRKKVSNNIIEEIEMEKIKEIK